MNSKADHFNYIVVGAGTSGCVLANRLSADPKARILLLEAGGRDQGIWMRLPVGYYKTIANSRSVNRFECETGIGPDNRKIAWPRGRVLGGSSSINGLVFIRGQHQDFDDWESLGASGWNYQAVLPYFRKFESYQDRPSLYRGTDGELSISDLRNDDPCCKAWLLAAKSLGFPPNLDFNAETTIGVGKYQVTVGRRWRASSATAFLHPISERPNLSVVTSAHATRVVIEHGRAIGVEWLGADGLKMAKADSAVVLSAGAIQTPQILQLSGVGPASLLEKHGIAVLVDAPEVGENLQDHYQVRMVVRMKDKKSLNNYVRNPTHLAAMGLDWLLFGRGPLTVGAGQVGGAFVSQYSDDGRPDMQLYALPLSVDGPGRPLHTFPGFTSVAWQCHPKSRGRIRIRSPHPLDAPSITANYLSEAPDVEVTVAALEMMRSIVGASPFVEQVYSEVAPGSGFQSTTRLAEYAKASGGTAFHPVGTCRMGADRRAVVNPDLKVQGIERLYVADASIMPKITSANTMAACYMIGEVAADRILKRRPVGEGP